MHALTNDPRFAVTFCRSNADPINCETVTCADFSARSLEAYGPETIQLTDAGTEATYDFPCFSGVDDADKIAAGIGDTYAVIVWCSEGGQANGQDQINWIWVEHDGEGNQVTCGDNTGLDCGEWDNVRPLDTGVVGTFGIREI